MSKPLLPFNWLPSSWGLKGKTRQRAEAEYYLEGYELAVRLAEIDHDDPHMLNLRKLEIDHQFKKIDDHTFEISRAELQLSDTDLVMRKLEIDRDHNRINQSQYDRAVADAKGEPWVSMPDIKWDPNDPSRSYFELDYNEHFVLFLREHKYSGTTPEEIVEKWLNDVCKSVAQEIEEDEPGFVAAAKPTRKIRQKKTKKTEYS
jgi:hypothetical protein